MNLSNEIGLDAQTIVTGRGCVIGQSGSGKSFLIGVVAEELAKSNMPFCVVDTEGEYSSLKSSFNAIIIGGSNKDAGLDVDYTKLFQASIENSIPVVLDLSDTSDKQGVVYDAMDALFSLESSLRRPYLVIIEEADKFVPQVVSKRTNPIEEIAFRGRKRGLGLFIATQRPANISKNVLAQCSYGFIGRLTIDNDVNAIRILFSSRKALTEVTTLKVGEFIPFGMDYHERFKVKGRVTKAMGSTPLVSAPRQSSAKINSIIKSLSGNAPQVKPITSRETRELKIQSLQRLFSEDDAKEFAERMKRKQFGVFGKSVENVDTVSLQYAPLELVSMRFPTNRRNEYLEYYALLSEKGRLVKFTDRTKFFDYVAEKEGEQRNFLAYNIYTPSLSKVPFKLEDSSVAKADLVSKGLGKKRIQKLVTKFFPSAVIIDTSRVYLPFYRIVLRANNKIRVFTVNAVDGRTFELS